MQQRTFGKTGLCVSEIGFGCSRIGGVFSRSQGADSPLLVLQKAFEAGITFYDTADMYSQGETETLLGRAFRGKRSQIVIASKGGFCLPARRKLIARIKPLVRPLIKAFKIRRENLPAAVAGSIAQDFSPAYLMQALENSLRRLRTDYLDLYQVHSPPAPVIQSGEFLEVLERMKQQGKIRHYGIAAETVEDAALCTRYPQIASLQTPFGLLDPEPLETVFPAAEPHGTALIARGCFGGGLLKESLTEAQLRDTAPKASRILACRRLAEQQGRSVLDMALHYVLHVPSVSVTLLGMRTEEHLRENLRHYAAAPLSDAEYAAIVRLTKSF